MASTVTVCVFITCCSACSISCVCIVDKATCRSSYPSGIVFSENIREVDLHDLNASFLTKKTIYANSKWSKIENLEIFAVGDESLCSRIFTGLSGLTSLWILQLVHSLNGK